MHACCDLHWPSTLGCKRVASISPVHSAVNGVPFSGPHCPNWLNCERLPSLAFFAPVHPAVIDYNLCPLLPTFTQMWLSGASFDPVHSVVNEYLLLPLQSMFRKMRMLPLATFPWFTHLSASALSCLHCLSSLICEWVLPKMEGSCVNDGWHGARNCTTNVCSHKFVSPFYWVNSVLAEEITHTLRTHTKKCCMLIYLVLHLHIMYICTLTVDRFLNWIILLGYV